MKQLQILGLVLITMLFANTVFSQDTTQYEVYDVIYLTDGRVLKGQILSYDSQLGGISFRDIHGRVYNFSREEYKYFVEKQSFPVNKKSKKEKAIRERKSNGIRYTLGINSNYHVGLERITDDIFADRIQTSGYSTNIFGTAGHFFTRNHFLGATAEIGVLTENPKFYNFGIRYNYEYDLKQTNLSKYIPIEIKYQNFILRNSGIWYSEVTQWGSSTGMYYPKTEMSTILLSVGHGFGFILKQGGSVNIEVAYQRHVTLSQKFYNLKPEDAEGYDPRFQINGFRLGISLSF